MQTIPARRIALRGSSVLTAIAALLASQVVLAQSGASCPLPLSKQVEAVKVFGEMLPVFRHPRCFNCHGGLNLFSEAHAGSEVVDEAIPLIPREPFDRQCGTCHGALKTWTGAEATWTIPGPPVFFIEKSDEELCLQMKTFTNTGEKFVNHIFNDEGGPQFIAEGFKGTRGLDASYLEEHGIAEKPPGTHEELTEKARKWVEILGDTYATHECGCVFRLEGRFEQTNSGALGTIVQLETVTGDIIWTPEQGEPTSPTFGEGTRSSFLRPSGGEITVDTKSEGQGPVGPASCEYSGSKTFRVADLPRSALRYVSLEIADDGRYKLSLGMQDGFLLMQVASVCRFPGVAPRRETLDSNQTAIQIGVHEGTLSDEGVVGRLATPIRRGPRTIDGSWSFAPPSARP